jgi:alpha-beta hydrolase superfamily lysophospholipase
MGLARRVFFLAGAALAFPVLVIAFFCAVYAATWHGVGVAGGVIASVVSTLAIIHGGRAGKRPRRIKTAWLVVAGASVTFLYFSATRAAKGRGGDPQLLVEHAFLDPDGQLPGASAANLFCEWDQVAIGTALARWFDPKIDARQAKRIRQLTFPLYEAMSSDPAFADMGSVLAWAYSSVLSHAPAIGHYVAIVPRREEGRSGGFVVFLHGGAGNFSSLWYALAPLARDHGHTLLCPSFRFGNWHEEGGVETIQRTIKQARSRFVPTPPRQVIVALSDAGPGAMRFVEKQPTLVKAVILLSARFDSQELARGASGGVWRDVPVLLVHGADDRRIPVRQARDAAGVLREAGADVTLLVLEGEDHSLFFSQRPRVLREIAVWLRDAR